MTESQTNEMEQLLLDISSAIENIIILQRSITLLQCAPVSMTSDVQIIQAGVSRWQAILTTSMEAFRVKAQDFLMTQPSSSRQDVPKCNRSHRDSPVRSYDDNR